MLNNFDNNYDGFETTKRGSKASVARMSKERNLAMDGGPDYGEGSRRYSSQRRNGSIAKRTSYVKKMFKQDSTRKYSARNFETGKFYENANTDSGSVYHNYIGKNI